MSSRATWLLDIGNTRGKWLRVDGASSPERGYFEGDTLPAQLAGSLPAAQVFIASVASPRRDRTLQSLLEQRGHAVWFARSKSELPGLRNSYSDPTRMGVDRWLAMLAGSRRCAGRFCVIDAGSALTIDFVDAGGRHEGGYILPGRHLMEQALLGQTDRVRFKKAAGQSLQPGRSTAEAVNHGVALAMVGAVDTALQVTSPTAGTLQLLLCGGDADLLESLIDRDFQRVDNLVFEGLLIQAALESVLESAAPLLEAISLLEAPG